MRQRKIWAGLVLVLLCTLIMGMSVFAADATMKNKTWVSGKGGAYVDSDKDGKIDDFQSWRKSYYKIQIPKQGYIVVEAKTSSLPGEKQYLEYINEDGDRNEEVDHSTSLFFLNAKKKQLAEHSDWLSGKNNLIFTAVVKKGTYYVAAEGDQKYQLRYSFTPVSKVSKTGKRPAKAVSLKKGKTVKSLITGDRDQYFKISLKKRSKVTLAFNARVRAAMMDGLGIQFLIKKGNVCKVIDEKGKLVSKGILYYNEVTGKTKVTVTLPKGTYYIRAFAWEGTGGYYTMKWR